MSTPLHRKLQNIGWQFENTRLHTEPACERITELRPSWLDTDTGKRVELRRALERMLPCTTKLWYGATIARGQWDYTVNGKRCKTAQAAVVLILGEAQP